MNVYVESNFVLELALQQEQWKSCEEILRLADEGKCKLLIPALALVEPCSALEWKRKSRKRLSQELNTIRDLGRSYHARHLPQSYEALSNAVAAAEQHEDARMQEVAQALRSRAEVLPMTSGIVSIASSIGWLVQPDAIMLASVVAHLEEHAAPSLFLNRNKNDFDVPDAAELLGPNCEMVFHFGEGVHRIRAAY